MAWHRRVLSSDNSLGQLVKGLRVERRLECGHFVQQHTHGPDVRLEIVALTLDDLWRQIVGRSDDSFGSRSSVTQDPCDSEVTELDNAAFGHEDILRLEIAVKDLFVVYVLHGEANLSENVQKIVLGPEVWSAAIIIFSTFLDFAL